MVLGRVGESLHSSLCMKPSLAKSGSGLDLWLYCNQPSCTFQSNDVVVILGKEYECHDGVRTSLGTSSSGARGLRAQA